MQHNVNAKQVMDSCFGEEGVKPIKKGYKANCKYLINDGMKRLLSLDSTHQIEVKRSGAGIVVLVTEK